MRCLGHKQKFAVLLLTVVLISGCTHVRYDAGEVDVNHCRLLNERATMLCLSEKIDSLIGPLDEVSANRVARIRWWSAVAQVSEDDEGCNAVVYKYGQRSRQTPYYEISHPQVIGGCEQFFAPLEKAVDKRLTSRPFDLSRDGLMFHCPYMQATVEIRLESAGRATPVRFWSYGPAHRSQESMADYWAVEDAFLEAMPEASPYSSERCPTH